MLLFRRCHCPHFIQWYSFLDIKKEQKIGQKQPHYPKWTRSVLHRVRSSKEHVFYTWNRLRARSSAFLIRSHHVKMQKVDEDFRLSLVYSNAFFFPAFIWPVLIYDSTISLSSPLTVFQIAALMITRDFWLQGERCITNERHLDSEQHISTPWEKGKNALFPFYHTDVKC